MRNLGWRSENDDRLINLFIFTKLTCGFSTQSRWDDSSHRQCADPTIVVLTYRLQMISRSWGEHIWLRIGTYAASFLADDPNESKFPEAFQHEAPRPRIVKGCIDSFDNKAGSADLLPPKLKAAEQRLAVVELGTRKSRYKDGIWRYYPFPHFA